MTWARQHSPESQPVITEAYNSIGQELGAIVVPVGLAWQRFLAEHKSPVLHDKDQSHPSPAGSYLAACVFLAVLLKLNPVGIKFAPAGLASEELESLQQATWMQFKPQPRGGRESRRS
jgi:hypothetical protein